MPRRRYLETEEARQARARKFAAALADALHALKLTHQQVARDLKVPRATVDSWTRVQAPNLPSEANFEKLCYLLDGYQPGLGRKLSASVTGDALIAQSDLVALTNRKRALASNFIGREREIAITQNSLRDHRLVTLTGPGGIGKTRLALRVATEMMVEFADGVTLIEFSDLREATLVPQAVALVLGVREQKKDQWLAALAENLQEKQKLLLFDNCEHLIPACRDLVQSLLAACPSLRILATSREPLGVEGEIIGEVPPMTLPESPHPPIAELMKREATRLFIERAFLHRQDLALTTRNSVSITNVCRRLDGVPLAIELAAACTLVMPVEDIATRLNDRFLLLTHGGDTVMSRHQTLRAAIDWSYDLLSARERNLFAQLSVFAGGCTRQAAEAVAGPDAILFDRLVDKSLLVAEDRDGVMRYRMLETIREYARERLDLSAESKATLRRHAEYFLTLAERAAPEFRGANQARSMNELEIEYDNCRVALSWHLDNRDAEQAMRFIDALVPFWRSRGNLSEGRRWLEQVIEIYRVDNAMNALAHNERVLFARTLIHAGRLALDQSDYMISNQFSQEGFVLSRELQDSSDLSYALNNLGLVAWHQGSYADANALFGESLSIRRELGDKRGIAQSLLNLGNVAGNQGDYDAASTYYEERLTISRELSDKEGIALALCNLGVIAKERGDNERSGALYEQSLALYRELGDKPGIILSLNNLGSHAHIIADLAKAQAYFDECLAISREIGDQQQIAVALANLGFIVKSQRDHRARAFLQESLVIHLKIGHKRGIAECLAELADVTMAEDKFETAAILASAASHLVETIGAAIDREAQTDLDRAISTARAKLDEENFNAAWEQGRTWSLEQAVQFALAK